MLDDKAVSLYEVRKEATSGGKDVKLHFRADINGDGKYDGQFLFEGRGYLKNGVFSGDGKLYLIDKDGNKILLNPRGGLAHIEGLRIDSISSDELHDALSTPTIKLDNFSVGADGKLSLEGTRTILQTFSQAIDPELDKETRNQAMTKAKFYLHLLEQDPALRESFVRSMQSILTTYVQQTHDVEIGSKLATRIKGALRLAFGEDTKKSFLGKIVAFFTGFSTEAKTIMLAEGEGALKKEATEKTLFNKFAAAIQGILTEGNEVLSDEEQIKALAAMYDTALNKAISVVKDKEGEYSTDRSLGRVLTGVLPFVDHGRTFSHILHSAWDRLPQPVKDIFTALGELNTLSGTQPYKSMTEAEALNRAVDVLQYESGLNDTQKSLIMAATVQERITDENQIRTIAEIVKEKGIEDWNQVEELARYVKDHNIQNVKQYHSFKRE